MCTVCSLSSAHWMATAQTPRRCTHILQTTQAPEIKRLCSQYILYSLSSSLSCLLDQAAQRRYGIPNCHTKKKEKKEKKSFYLFYVNFNRGKSIFYMTDFRVTQLSQQYESFRSFFALGNTDESKFIHNYNILFVMKLYNKTRNLINTARKKNLHKRKNYVQI